MRFSSIVIASLSFISVCSVFSKHLHSDYIELGPAYSVKFSGNDQYQHLNTYAKEKFFVEGLEMLSDDILIQSAGLYSGSQL